MEPSGETKRGTKRSSPMSPSTTDSFTVFQNTRTSKVAKVSECFEAIEETEDGKLKYKCPECGGGTNPNVKNGALFHFNINNGTKECPYKGKKYCQQVRGPKSILPPPDKFMIEERPIIKYAGKCFSHKGKYLGKLLRMELTGRPFDKVLECTFEHGTVTECDDSVMVTIVPCRLCSDE